MSIEAISNRDPGDESDTHHDPFVMRRERRARVEQAFGATERRYLEALEAVADATNGGDLEKIADRIRIREAMNALAEAEYDASEKGRH